MSEIKFNIGQDVVYPSQGVGRITEIFEKFNLFPLKFYII